MPGSPFPAALPIVQAPMAGVQDSALAIAVSRAGGVGSLPCAMLTTERLNLELETLRSAELATYNLNFFCHDQPAADDAAQHRWREALAPYYLEYGLDPADIPSGPGRVPFSAETLAVIAPFAPPIVSFHFGLPEREWVDAIKAWGGRVWSTATTVEEAEWLVARGADAVIAQGLEAGGHRGMFLTEDVATQLTTSALLQGIQKSCSVPIIAAGGIAQPQHVKAVLDGGAAAAQVGTAYLCCHEATTSEIHRECLMSSTAPDTALTNVFSGRLARGMTNRIMQELGPISDLAPAFPLASAGLAPLRNAAEAGGLGDFSPLWSGVDRSGCRSVSAAEQTRWLASEIDVIEGADL